MLERSAPPPSRGAAAPEPLITADGLQLSRVAWPAHALHDDPLAPVRGTVLVVHGLGEHGERYVRLAADLCRDGWDVQAYDQRGHGASEGRRGALASDTSLVDDLSLLLRTLRDERVARPLVLLGHSLGGAVAAHTVASSSAGVLVDALVLSSPALDPGLPWWRRAQLHVAAALVPDLAVHNGLSPRWICRDPRVVRHYVDDPRVHDRASPRLARWVLEAGRACRAAAPQWRVPTLLMWAGADRCVAPSGSAAFAAAAPPEIVQSRCFAGLAHEIFNEPEREQVIAILLDWLRRRSAPPTPARPAGVSLAAR